MRKNFKSIWSLLIFISLIFAAFTIINSYAQGNSDEIVAELEECVQVLEKYRQNPDTLSQEELRRALTCLEIGKKSHPQRQKPTTIFRLPEKDREDL